MNNFIAVSGLDCEKCEARLATINNDDELRKKVAGKWSKLNGIEILPSSINCVGCRIEGVKTPFCESLCPIRQCAIKEQHETCGECSKLHECSKIKMIIEHNEQALNNLKK